MIRFGAIVRAVMLVVCLVPFTSVQQASGALAPFLPITPVSESEAPGAPVGEEDERETDGKERHASASRHHTPVRELVDKLPPTHASHRIHVARIQSTPPVAVDPFRNGLGTPYRC